MTEDIKKVSKKKIVFVQIDEEITAIFERVKNLPYKDIYLVVPKRAILLQSIVNLKILKQKLEEIDKNLSIISADPNGMKLAHQAEIAIFDHVDFRKSSADRVDQKEKDSAILSPVGATSNEVADATPSRLPKKKSSIFEIVKELRGREKGFSLKAFLKERKQHSLTKESLNLYLPAGVRKFLSALLVISILIFAFIAYVVLPGATIYIEPASQVITKSTNVSLSPNPSGDKEIKSYALESTVELTIEYKPSGVVNEGANASGTVTLINKQNSEQVLIKNTRLQTEDGLIFRIQSEVTVPRASGETPGTVEVNVLADALDVNNSAIGTRGNIGPSKFFLPGLREETRELVYAESYVDMTGGESNIKTFVVEEDLNAVRSKIETQLKEKALASLRKEAISKGHELGFKASLLENSKTITYGSAIINLPYDIIGQEMESFEVTGTLDIEGVIYDQDALIKMLKTELAKAETPGKQLIQINDNSVSIDLIESNNTNLTYKFTASIQGVEEYKIEYDKNEAGGVLPKKIKEHIAGMKINEAEVYIQNLPEVNKVEIKIWPVWSPNIPTLSDNIKIKSLSKEDAIQLEK